jgi:hypothetical protein
MQSKVLCTGMVLAAALTASSASAATLFSQAFDPVIGSAQASDNATNGLGAWATTYDNFMLSSAATITSVDFVGMFLDFPAGAPHTEAPITKFTLTIYNNSGFQPGSAIYTTSVNGNANQTSLGAYNGLPADSYSIATDFSALGGATYWLSIVADLDYPPAWGWGISSTHGVSYLDYYGQRYGESSEMAFALNSGGAVPEPASWAMMVAGLGLAGVMLRRRTSVSPV